MRRITAFLLVLFCVVTLTTPTMLAARMLPVSALCESAHCQTGVDHPNHHQAEAAQSDTSAVPMQADAGDCTDCSSCLICACQCTPLMGTSSAPQVASHSSSMPEPTLVGRCGITAAPELKPPRT
jgi:hypothetical protein